MASRLQRRRGPRTSRAVRCYRCNRLLCGSGTGEEPVKQQYAESECAYGIQSEVSNEHRSHALRQPIVPLPRNADQCSGANDDGPPEQPEHPRLPHGRREHDQCRPNKQAKDLLDVVRSRRGRESHQESLGTRWVRKGDAREGDEGETKHDNDDSCDNTHGTREGLIQRDSMPGCS